MWDLAVRFATDVGGTFTDLVIETDDEVLHIYKSPSTPEDPVRGVLDAFGLAAQDLGVTTRAVLAQGDILVHATTRAINAVLTGATARTAFLTTAGHPDVLLLREGGRKGFNRVQEFPRPYVPRSLTFEVPERIDAQGMVVQALDIDAARGVIDRLGSLGVEAVAVCLLWSIRNPAHELELARLLDEHLPGVPYTLSHRLNPTIREYRRASSAAIDASLKPAMGAYLADLERRLREEGYTGRLLMVTSSGGVLDAREVADAPVHALKSGPAMAPVAGRYYGQLEAQSDSVIVADTGGTSYDVSLVRSGAIPWTREAWLGAEFESHITGFPSVDVRSIGAGGGSIAWVDEGGLLHVGPESAGAVPGPACYGRGGELATVTDAALVLGYIDASYFLGGRMLLDHAAAEKALHEHVGVPLGLSMPEAAAAVMSVITENMVQLIEQVALDQGVDARAAVLVGGGGAAGLNAVAIARRLGCRTVIIPDTGPLLSATGALMTDIIRDHDALLSTSSSRFDFVAVNELLSDLEKRCHAFIDMQALDLVASGIELSAQVRYASEIWELEVPLRQRRFGDQAAVDRLRADFDQLHEEVFTTRDPASDIVIIAWRGRARCRYREDGRFAVRRGSLVHDAIAQERQVFVPSIGHVRVPVFQVDHLTPGERVTGPAIVESAVTTVVVDPGAEAARSASGSLLIWHSDSVA